MKQRARQPAPRPSFRRRGALYAEFQQLGVEAVDWMRANEGKLCDSPQYKRLQQLEKELKL